MRDFLTVCVYSQRDSFAGGPFMSTPKDATNHNTLAELALRSNLQDFIDAAERMREDVVRSPLLPFAHDGERTIRLKAENLQPLGSFKIRCGVNALGAFADKSLQGGVATVSAGNFAQGLALAAQRRGVQLTAHVPETAAGVKIDKLRQLGVSIVRHTFADWWRIAMTRDTGADDGVFIHPVCELGVIRGNATIGLELAEQWPELDTIVVPFGGGGLVSGIALGLRALGKRVRVVACEVEGAASLTAARAAGRSVPIEKVPTFVDGIGSNSVLDDMWPLLNTLVDDVVVVSVAQVKSALRKLFSQNHLVVEGAGAAALAAALSLQGAGKNVAAILSGGNIDPATLCGILAERD
jgi:threonine dehydratase